MANIYDMVDTWNDSGTTFAAIKMNVTDTASDAASLLMDLQVGGSSKFKVGKDAKVTIYGAFAAIGAGGVQRFALSGSGIQRYSQDVGPQWTNDWANTGTVDLMLARDAANTLAQRNSTNAQTFNLYNTYTDSSNYERGFMKWNSNVLEIGTEAAGTGANRDIFIKAGASRTLRFGGDSGSIIYFTPGNQQGFRMNASAHFYPSIDSTLDIGLAANKVRKIYADALDGSVLTLDSLPTADPVNAGQLWNDSGTLKVSAG